jgi:hypothetical protein
MQDDEAYQRQLDIAAQADAEEGIRQGLEQARKGMLQPVREFFDEFEASHPDLWIKADAGSKPDE